MIPRRMVVAIVMSTAVMRFFFIQSFQARALSGKPSLRDQDVDDLDSDEGHDDATDAVDQKVIPQENGGGERPVLYAAQRQRNQDNDDQGVEDYVRQDG